MDHHSECISQFIFDRTQNFSSHVFQMIFRIIPWVAAVSQSAQLISVGFIPESHWDYPTVSAVKVISLAHSKLVMLHDWLNLRKRNLIGSDTNWRQGYCIAITLQLLFVTSNLERLGLGRTWTVNLTAYHLDSDLFKAIRGCTYKIRWHKLRRKCWRLLTLCFLRKN